MKQVLSRPDASSDSASADSNLGDMPLRKRLPQFSLGTLLLVTACIAVWGSTWMNHRRIQELQRRTTDMRVLARELVIKDRNHIAIIQKHPELYDQQIWDIYLPSDSLGLHLATRGVPPTLRDVRKAVEGPVTTTALPAGRHVVELKSELKENEWLTQVFVDDEPVITVREPKEWNAGRGSSGGGLFSSQADLPPDQPVVLFSRIFMIPEGPMNSKLPTQPGNGVVLWIDQLPSAPQQAR